jgi:hypothetical protein
MLNLNRNRSEFEVKLMGGPFGVFQYELSNVLYAIRLLVDDSEGVLIERKEELQKLINAELSQVDWNQYEGYTSSYEMDSEIRYITIYYALYNSAFLSAYSAFETSLRGLFDYLVKIKGLNASINGDNLDSIKNSYKESFGITLGSSSYWSLIKDYQQIRNCIAHRNSTIKLKDGEALDQNRTYQAYSRLKGEDHLLLFKPTLDFRIANKNFIHDYTMKIESFFKSLESNVNGFIFSEPNV